MSFIDSLITRALAFARRRQRNSKHALPCPLCGTPQVQLLSVSRWPPARWKCRECGHSFVYEPLILQ